jgi:hypothetical protein
MAGAPVQTFHVDSRLPISDKVSESDPSHPKNIIRSTLIIQNQATADTKYDIYPPPRIEGFMSLPLPTQKHMLAIVMITAILTTIISIGLLTYTGNRVHRVFFIVAAVLGIHYAVISLEKVAVYN